MDHETTDETLDVRLSELIASLEITDPSDAPALAAQVADLLAEHVKG